MLYFNTNVGATLTTPNFSFVPAPFVPAQCDENSQLEAVYAAADFSKGCSCIPRILPPVPRNAEDFSCPAVDSSKEGLPGLSVLCSREQP